MKKIIGLILCFAMILNSTLVLAESKLSEQTAEALEILQTLEFINQDYSEETIDFSAELTRAEFADAVGKIFNVNNIEGTELYFHDVPADYYAYDSITYLVSIGAISGNGNKQFYPDDKISVTDAAKIILYGLGYNFMIEANGGYPDGVKSAASSLDLLKGVPGVGGNLTYEGMIRILYNTIFTEVLEVDSMKEGSLQYKGKGETFLSSNYDIYFEEGVVTGVNGGDYGSVKSEEDQVAINETIFEANGEDYSDFLGYKVRYLYHYDEENEEYSLIWMKNIQNKDVLEISYVDNEVMFNPETYQITYVNESGKRKVADLEKTIKVIYNGRLLSTGINDVLGGPFETVRLFDLSNDSDFDLAIVYKYDNYIVDTIDVVNGIIYDKFSNKSLDFEKYEESYIYNADGSLILPEEIPIGCVVSAYPSYDNDVIRAYVSITIKDGKLSLYKENDDMTKLLVVDGEEYYCFYDFIPNIFRYGDIKLWIDINGYVAGLEYSSNTDKYAYFIKASVNDDEVYVKMFTEDGKMMKYKCRKNTQLDSVNYKKYYPEGLYGALGGPQLIRYSINDDEEITMIDTLTRDDASDFNKSHERMSRTYKGGKLIANSAKGSLIINSSTVAFNIPSNPSTADDWEFQIMRSNLLTDWRGVTCEGYSSTKDPFIVEALVCYDAVPTNWDAVRYLLVDKVSQIIDDDGDAVTKIQGYYGSSERSVETDPNYKPEDIQRGDVIYFTYDRKGSVIDVTLKYRPGSEITPGFLYDHANNYNLLEGYVYDTENGMVKVASTPNADEADDIYKVSTVWIYDGESIEKGTANDLVGSKTSGKADKIVLYTSQGYVSTAYVFK